MDGEAGGEEGRRKERKGGRWSGGPKRRLREEVVKGRSQLREALANVVGCIVAPIRF